MGSDGGRGSWKKQGSTSMQVDTGYQRDVGHEVHEMRNGKERRIFSLDLDKSVVLQRTCNIIIDGCYQKEGEMRLV